MLLAMNGEDQAPPRLYLVLLLRLTKGPTRELEATDHCSAGMRAIQGGTVPAAHILIHQLLNDTSPCSGVKGWTHCMRFASARLSGLGLRVYLVTAACLPSQHKED